MQNMTFVAHIGVTRPDYSIEEDVDIDISDKDYSRLEKYIEKHSESDDEFSEIEEFWEIEELRDIYKRIYKKVRAYLIDEFIENGDIEEENEIDNYDIAVSFSE